VSRNGVIRLPVAPAARGTIARASVTHVGRFVVGGVVNWSTNPQAAVNITGWSYFAGTDLGTLSRITGDGPAAIGTTSAEISLVTTAARTIYLGTYTAPSVTMPVVPGQVVYGYGWGKAQSVPAGGAITSINLKARWLASDGTYLGEVSVAATLPGAPPATVNNPTVGTWYELSGQQVVPDGAFYMALLPVFTTNAVTGAYATRASGLSYGDSRIVTPGVYMDGSQPGARWDGPSQNSRSVADFARRRRGLASRANNLVSDGTFESGTSGWAGQGNTTAAVSTAANRSGTQSLAATTNTPSGVSLSDGAISPMTAVGSVLNGDVLDATVWIMSQSALQVLLQVNSRDASTTGLVSASSPTVTLSPGVWTRINVRLAATDPATSRANIKILLVGTTQTGTFYVDDVTFVKQRPGRLWAGGPSYIPNVGFESGAYAPFWSDHAYDGGTGTPPTGTRAVDTVRPHSGTYSLHLVKDAAAVTGQEWGVLHNTARDLTPGYYRIGGWIWADTTSVAAIQGNLEGSYRNYLTANVASQWRYYETVVYFDGGVRSLRLFIAGTTAAVTAYFDDVFMVPVAGYRRGTVTRLTTTHTGRIAAPAIMRGGGIRNRTRVLMEWGDDAAHRILFRYSTVAQAWELIRANNNEEVVQIPAPEPTSGTSVLVIARWEAGKLGLSVGGAPFVDIPSGLATAIQQSVVTIGSDQSYLNSPNLSYKWGAFGAGTLQDADAATLGGFGLTDPSLYSLPSSAGATAVMSFDTTLYRVAAIRADMTKREQWQRVVLTHTPAVTAVTVEVAPIAGSTAGEQAWLDGVQFEQKAYPTPYKQTNGATVSRAVTRLQIPTAAIFTPAQGFVVARLMLGFPSTAPGDHYLFSWGSSLTDCIQFYWDGTNDVWASRRVAGGVSGPALALPDTFAAGDRRTLFFEWDAVRVSGSIQGAAPIPAANSQVAASLPGTAEIGSNEQINPSGNQQIDSNFLWTLAGRDIPPSGAAATLFAYGDTLPTDLRQIPVNPLAIWLGVDANALRIDITAAPHNYIQPTISGVVQSGRVLSVNPGVWGGESPVRYDYAWERSNDGVAWQPYGGDSGQVVLGDGDVSYFFRVKVTATNRAGSSSVYAGGGA
jgi:hypothetical protein